MAGLVRGAFCPRLSVVVEMNHTCSGRTSLDAGKFIARKSAL